MTFEERDSAAPGSVLMERAQVEVVFELLRNERRRGWCMRCVRACVFGRDVRSGSTLLSEFSAHHGLRDLLLTEAQSLVTFPSNPPLGPELIRSLFLKRATEFNCAIFHPVRYITADSACSLVCQSNPKPHQPKLTRCRRTARTTHYGIPFFAGAHNPVRTRMSS